MLVSKQCFPLSSNLMCIIDHRSSFYINFGAYNRCVKSYIRTYRLKIRVLFSTVKLIESVQNQYGIYFIMYGHCFIYYAYLLLETLKIFRTRCLCWNTDYIQSLESWIESSRILFWMLREKGNLSKKE